ncbi:MAG: caspase family protein [Cyclobacteriaceae bacterium]
MRKKYWWFCLVFLIQTLAAQQIEIAVQKGHSGDIVAIVFNQDGTLLASAGADHLIKLWHVPTGKEMASFTSSVLLPVSRLEFVEEADFLNVTYSDGMNEKWDIVNSVLFEITQKSKVEQPATFVSKDKNFQVGIEKFYLRKKSLPSEKILFSRVPIDISEKYTGIAVSETHNMILAANEDGTVYVYNLANGKSLKILEDHFASVNAVCFSPNNAVFATASSDRSIILWSTQSLLPVKRLFGKSYRYETLVFNHSGTQLAVGDELGFGRIIDLRSSRMRVSVTRLHDQKISALRFSHNDSLVYSGGFDNRLTTYNVRSEKVISKSVYMHYFSTPDFLFKLLGVYRDPYAWINCIDLSPQGSRLAMGGAWRESAIRKSVQPLATSNPSLRNWKKVSAHQGAINDVLFLNETNFFTAASDLLINWHYDSSSAKFYFRDKHLPGVNQIKNILKAPDNTILLQSENVLIHYDVQGETILDSIHVPAPITAVTLNPVNGQLVYAMLNTLVFSNISDWHNKKVTITGAHSDRITSIDYNPSHPTIATCSWDATVKLWDAETMKLLATIISIGSDDHIIITPDNYYYGTRNSLKGIGFKYGKVFISPEQYDLRFNRPDIVLDRIGYVPKPVVKSFNRAYLKRLQKMNFTEKMLGEDIHMPTVEIKTENLPLQTNASDISISFKAQDTKYRLDRINVFVNDIPVFGLHGIPLRDQDLQENEQTLSLTLSSGRNKIQVSCLNEKGVESLFQTYEITYKPAQIKRPDLYLAVISVSDYASPAMKLKYARKDGQDLVELFSRSGWYEHVLIDTLYDKEATIENIQKLRSFFLNSGVEDEVILFVSGHGLLDINLDFYFGTYDIDFKNPAVRGIGYEALEGLLDGIPARKKLLLMDACHSGEVDKSRIQTAQLSADLSKNQKGTVTAYTYPTDIEAEHYKIGITTSFELMQEVFSNVSKGSGAIVISAAAGNSYALESDQWKNGVFTYALLSGMKNKRADKNKDGIITVTEIKDYVSIEVEKLTKGEQRPTSRRENLEFDFRVW